MKKSTSFLSLAIAATMLVGNASAQTVSVTDTDNCTGVMFGAKPTDKSWKPKATAAVKACKSAGGAKAWNAEKCRCVVAGDKLSIYINMLKDQGITISGLQAERDAAKAEANAAKTDAADANKRAAAAQDQANRIQQLGWKQAQAMANDAARKAREAGTTAEQAIKMAEEAMSKSEDLDEARRLVMEANAKATAAEEQLAAARLLNDQAEAGLRIGEGNNSARPVIAKNRIEVFPPVQTLVNTAKDAVKKASEAIEDAGGKADADKDRAAREAAEKAEAERKAREKAELLLKQAQDDLANSRPAEPQKPIEKGATHGFVNVFVGGDLKLQSAFTCASAAKCGGMVGEYRGVPTMSGTIGAATGIESGVLRLTLFIDLAPFTGANFSKNGTGPTLAGMGGFELTFNVARMPWTDDSLKLGLFLAGVGAHTNSDLVNADLLSFGAVGGIVARFPFATIPSYGTFFLVCKAGGGGEWYGTTLPSGEEVSAGGGLGVINCGAAYEL